eukprot:2544735-Rhodomonas_salina.1
MSNMSFTAPVFHFAMSRPNFPPNLVNFQSRYWKRGSCNWQNSPAVNPRPRRWHTRRRTSQAGSDQSDAKCHAVVRCVR